MGEIKYLKKKENGGYNFCERAEADYYVIDLEMVEKIRKTTQKKAELETENQTLKKELQEFKSKNKTLLKINKGKANKERGLPDRNKNVGYRPLRSALSYNTHYKELLWKTTFETPYDLHMASKDVTALFLKDFEKLKAIFGFAGMYDDTTPEESADMIKNWVFEYFPSWTLRDGYWVMDVVHNLPLMTEEIPFEETDEGKRLKEIREINEEKMALITPDPYMGEDFTEDPE